MNLNPTPLEIVILLAIGLCPWSKSQLAKLANTNKNPSNVTVSLGFELPSNDAPKGAYLETLVVVLCGRCQITEEHLCCSTYDLAIGTYYNALHFELQAHSSQFQLSHRNLCSMQNLTLQNCNPLYLNHILAVANSYA